MYHHILVPLENSAVDEVILEHIRGLARMTGGRLTLLHVAEGFGARNQQALDLEDSREIREDRAYLTQREAELAAEGFSVRSILEQGEPVTKIIEVVEREGCDLIAMSTHGHRWLADLILGSVASAVRHRTDVPVLLVRASQKKPVGQAPRA